MKTEHGKEEEQKKKQEEEEEEEKEKQATTTFRQLKLTGELQPDSDCLDKSAGRPSTTVM